MLVKAFTFTRSVGSVARRPHEVRRLGEPGTFQTASAFLWSVEAISTDARDPQHRCTTRKTGTLPHFNDARRPESTSQTHETDFMKEKDR
jgi:hypothetical protein